MSDENKITTAGVSATIMAELESALVENQSFAFTRSQVPIVVPVNRSGSVLKKTSAIEIYVIAVGDTDAVDEFRKTRNAFQGEVGAVRAARQGAILGYDKE